MSVSGRFGRDMMGGLSFSIRICSFGSPFAGSRSPVAGMADYPRMVESSRNSQHGNFVDGVDRIVRWRSEKSVESLRRKGLPERADKIVETSSKCVIFDA